MLIMHLYKTIAAACALIFLLSSCTLFSSQKADSEPDKLPSLEMESIPFPDDATESNPAGPFPFTMNYSTLAHTDVENPYQYFRYKLDFPQEVLNEARGETRTIRFRFATKTDHARPDAGRDENGKVVLRFVNALIPDSETAEMMVKERTSYFQPVTNLHQVLVNEGSIDESEKNHPVRFPQFYE